MIRLEKINKSYKGKNKKYEVLKNVNISFSDKEFVSILGPSGSGKSTLLNIIGGLDKDYEGIVYLNGKVISGKNDKFYDYYRNQKIGFVFQNYNLIDNYSVYQNVELPLIINSKKHRKARVLEVLELVGLLKYKNKNVKELSGGERQRVAIARAIVNKPKVLLLDEPTGALDSRTSVLIMELIKKLSKDILVIMVTHNEKLAKDYSDRIITIKDGEVFGSNVISFTKEEFSFKKVGIKFLEIFKMAFRNLRVKLFRNVLTILAFMISIIGISMVFAMSDGFNKQVKVLEKDSLGNYPLTITSKSSSYNKNYSDDRVYSYKTVSNKNIDDGVINYLKDIDKDYIMGVTYNYEYPFKAVAKNENGFKFSDNLPFIAVPDDNKLLKENYTLLEGEFPQNNKEILLKVNNDNMIGEDVLKFLGIDDNTLMSNLIGKEIKLVYNDDLYSKDDDIFSVNKIDTELYNKANNEKLTIVGIIKAKSEMDFNTIINEEAGAIYFRNSLIEKVIRKNNESSIVKEQVDRGYNVLSLESVTLEEKDDLLTYLGIKQSPYMIYIYPNGYNNKEKVIDYLDSYEKKINYVDMGTDVINTTTSLVFGVTSILLILSGISLVITLILITIITYTSSVERKKEIGVLRSLGARGKDIKRLFVMENISISLIASLFSLLIVYILIQPLNKILLEVTGLSDLMVLSFSKVILIIIISILVAVTGSIAPAIKASKSDPVLSLK